MTAVVVGKCFYTLSIIELTFPSRRDSTADKRRTYRELLVKDKKGVADLHANNQTIHKLQVQNNQTIHKLQVQNLLVLYNHFVFVFYIREIIFFLIVFNYF